MAMRFRRSVKLAPGIRLNVGKKSASVRLGGRGYGYTVSTSGRRTKSVGIPGSGLHWTSSSGGGRSTGGSRRGQGGSGSQAAVAAIPQTIEQAIPGSGLFASKAEKSFRKGLIAYVRRELPDALTHFTTAREAAPDNSAAALFRGFTLASVDRDAEAISDLEQVLASTTGLPDRFMQKFCGRLDMRVEVIVVPGLRVPVEHDEFGAAMVLAEAYQVAGRTDDAIDLLEGLGDAGADEAVVACSLAELYLDAGAFEDVIRVTDGLGNEDDVSLAALVFRGAALRRLGLLDAAQETHKATLRSSKRDAGLLQRARYERALTYELQGNQRMYRKDIETVFATAPDFGDVRERLGI